MELAAPIGCVNLCLVPQPSSEPCLRIVTADPRPRFHGLSESFADLRDVMGAGLYWTEYEPVVEPRSQTVVGYEALARFRRQDGSLVPASSMFALLHADPELLARVELELKRHQIENGPAGAELFVNLDPDSWFHATSAQATELLGLLERGGRTVVEVIENMDAADALLGRDLVTVLKARGLRVALDDLGATNGLFSFEALEEADVFKFERSFLRRLGVRRKAIVEAFVHMARESGARTVMEGVETEADLDLAVALEMDLVQGHLFRDRAIVAGR
jgi:EAL domain-containing protein (putative c-di-GMP-specific phosphodiesterase class I)